MDRPVGKPRQIIVADHAVIDMSVRDAVAEETYRLAVLEGVVRKDVADEKTRYDQ